MAVGLALALRNRRRPFALAGMTSVALSVAMLALGVQAGHRGGALVHGVASVGAAAEGRGADAPQATEEEEETDSAEDDD